MTEDDLKAALREFKTSVSADLEATNARLDALLDITHRTLTVLNDMDERIDLRFSALEERVLALEQRVGRLERRWGSGQNGKL